MYCKYRPAVQCSSYTQYLIRILLKSCNIVTLLPNQSSAQLPNAIVDTNSILTETDPRFLSIALDAHIIQVFMFNKPARGCSNCFSISGWPVYSPTKPIVERHFDYNWLGFQTLRLWILTKTCQNRGGKTFNNAATNLGVLSVNITNLRRHIAHTLPF